MKIKKFVAKNVNSYQSYDIDFREDLTFLIGLNGCGKTTVLKLISGLLSPNFFFLSQIIFSEIILTLFDNKKEKELIIKAYKKDNKLILKIGEIEDIFDNFSQQNIDEMLYEQYVEKSESLLLNKFNDSRYAQEIKKNINPIVLGLDRRVRTFDRIEFIDTMYLPKRLGRFKLKYNEMDQALDDIRVMMHDKVRENANRKEQLSEKFKEDVLLELTNSATTPSLQSFFNKRFDFKTEIKTLEDKQIRLNKIIPLLKIETLQNSFDTLFDKAKNVLYELFSLLKKKESDGGGKEKEISIMIEWFNLQYQLDNSDKIIKIGTEYSNNIKYIDSSFTKLTDSLNMFFAETGKEVSITGEGDLQVYLRENREAVKKKSMFELSSGEKQLVILFSHLAFAKDSNMDVFIIDEPELSLHLSWQEKFVDALQKLSPEMQFILATHAPAIINERNKLGNCVNLSKKAN